MLLPKSLLLSSSPDKHCCGTAGGVQQPGCSASGLCPQPGINQTCVLLLKQVDTVVCIVQAQLLVQTLVQVPPPSCRGPPSAEGAPGQQGSVSYPEPIAHSELPEQLSSHPCSAPPLRPSPPSLPNPPCCSLARGCSPRPLAPGRGCVPAAPRAALRRLPAGTKQVN